MKAWVCFLSVVVAVQGGLLAFSLNRIHTLDRALAVRLKTQRIEAHELRVSKLTVSELFLETAEGNHVGGLHAGGGGGDGPRLSLKHVHNGTGSVLQFGMFVDVARVLMEQTGTGSGGNRNSRAVLEMRDRRLRLRVEPAGAQDSQELQISCGPTSDDAGGAPYSYWGYHVPGLPSLRHPRWLPVLRKELATLTPGSDETKQRNVIRELYLQHALGKAFPEIARLCEAHPEEEDFPRWLVGHAKTVEECHALVLESLDRRPSWTMVEVLGRMIIEGQDEVAEIDLREYLSALARRPDLLPAVKRHAESWDKSIRKHHPRKVPAKPERRRGEGVE